MDLKKFLYLNNAQKQINKLAKKYKNKKIVIYGAGEYFDLIRENYDLSELNIVGISDIKFDSDKSLNKTKYNALAPDELKTYDFDILVIALRNYYNLMKILDEKTLSDSKNKNVKIIPLVYPTFKYIFKLFSVKRSL